jgi:thioredoxin-related protein
MKQLIIILIILSLFNGCTLIRMGQESVEKIKTSSSYGYRNGIKTDKIRNIKDYIVDENDFVIIAEDPHHTLYKTRNKSNMGKNAVMTDLSDYCSRIKGTIKLGNQFGAALKNDFDSIDLDFSSAPRLFKENREKGYKAWMKCEDSEDDFEVSRKDRSDYFLITHKKEQLLGYSLQWYIDYLNLDETEVEAINVGLWSYAAVVHMGGLCYLHGGEAIITNRYTENKEMSLNSYLLQRFDPYSKEKPFILSAGSFRCENTYDKAFDVEFEISFSKQYRKLIYTKQ